MLYMMEKILNMAEKEFPLSSIIARFDEAQDRINKAVFNLKPLKLERKLLCLESLN